MLLIQLNISNIRKNCKFIKRIFAYLQIKQDLEAAEKLHSQSRDNRPRLDRAKETALEFNFVTDQTSLVVEIKSPGDEEYVEDDYYSYDEFSSHLAYIVPSDSMFGNLSIPAYDSTQNSDSPCKISLFSEEYYSGDKIVFTDDVFDISAWDFEDKLESLKVEGTCSWEIFTGEKVWSING